MPGFWVVVLAVTVTAARRCLVLWPNCSLYRESIPSTLDWWQVLATPSQPATVRLESLAGCHKVHCSWVTVTMNDSAVQVERSDNMASALYISRWASGCGVFSFEPLVS